MLKLVLSRLLTAIPVMLVVATLIFLILYITPGDPAHILAGDFASPAVIEATRVRLGLDQSIFVRYYVFISGLLQGDFGHSIFSGKSVLELMAQRAEPTIALTFLAMAVSLPISVVVGVIAAKNPNGFFDRALMAVSALGFSVPAFVLAFFLVYTLSLSTNLLPVQGYVPPRDGLLPFLSHLVLPTITVAAFTIALLARITRSSMLDVLGEDYVKTARAKGATEATVLFQHALPNASIPIITVTGISTATLITGVVVVETIYNIPGLGSLIMGAIQQRDYPLIQGITLVFSLVYILINLIVDVVCAMVDPRIRY